jgi:hypothetical protein
MAGENQHWIPKFLIKNFTDTDGRVYRLNILTDEVTKPPPKFTASNFGFNEFEIEGKQITFEDRLEKIETAAAPPLTKIVASKSLADLSERDKGKLADFIAAQSFRTEAFYRGMNPQSPRRDFGSTFASLWRSAFIIADEVARRDWALMVIGGHDVFYLGDSPVVSPTHDRPQGRQRTRLRRERH